MSTSITDNFQTDPLHIRERANHFVDRNGDAFAQAAGKIGIANVTPFQSKEIVHLAFVGPIEFDY